MISRQVLQRKPYKAKLVTSVCHKNSFGFTTTPPPPNLIVTDPRPATYPTSTPQGAPLPQSLIPIVPSYSRMPPTLAIGRYLVEDILPPQPPADATTTPPPSPYTTILGSPTTHPTPMPSNASPHPQPTRCPPFPGANPYLGTTILQTLFKSYINISFIS